MKVLLFYQDVLIVAAVVAVAVPVVFVHVREATKVRRQGIIENLISIFKRPQLPGSVSMPSFEFVKYKYFMRSEQAGRSAIHDDFLLRHWIIGSIPLCLFLFALNAFCLFTVLHEAFKLNFDVGVVWLSKEGRAPLFSWIVLSSYVGGLLFTLRAFNQAINNFDLSPLSLVGAVVNLAFGLASGLLLIFAVWKLLVDVSLGALSTPAAFPAMVATAFAAGYFPDVAVRNVLRLSQLRSYKQQDAALYACFKAVPIEVIDGIDSEISNRLSDYHIMSVQNLAAANPLMLFVETPYGVYQIMDWVAQAQLCASVGPTTLLALWRLGIRTIFDLERVALDRHCYDDDLIREIGAILWQGQDHGRAMALGQAAGHPPPYPTLSAVKADIRFRLENPHVHRLRQIFNQVGETIGDDARYLPPVGRRGRRFSVSAQRIVARRPLLRRTAVARVGSGAWLAFLWRSTP